MVLCNRINENNVGGILILPGGGGVIEGNDLRNNKIFSLGITKDILHKVRSSRNLEKDP